MKIKLEITSKPLTDEQREAIQGKLQEIKAIIKGTTNSSITDNQYRERSKREMKKWLNKFNSLLDEHPQIPLSPKEQNELLQDDTKFYRSLLIQQMFSRIRYDNNSVEGWITHPYSKDNEKAPKKPL